MGRLCLHTHHLDLAIVNMLPYLLHLFLLAEIFPSKLQPQRHLTPKYPGLLLPSTFEALLSLGSHTCLEWGAIIIPISEKWKRQRLEGKWLEELRPLNSQPRAPVLPHSHMEGSLTPRDVFLDSDKTSQPLCVTFGMSLPSLWALFAASIKQVQGMRIRGSPALACDMFIGFHSRQCMEFLQS